jgi:putative oxidoreductase
MVDPIQYWRMNMSETSSKATTIALWLLKILVALAFLTAGGAKLAGAPIMVAVFAKIGFGQWFRILTGVLEVAGAIALFVPRASFYGAVLLAVVMVGAIGFHRTLLGGNPTPPIVLLALSAVIAWLSRERTQAPRQGDRARTC